MARLFYGPQEYRHILKIFYFLTVLTLLMLHYLIDSIFIETKCYLVTVAQYLHKGLNRLI